jgi:hypothetical protein
MMFKNIIAPIVSVLAMAVALLTGVEIDATIQAQIVSGASILVGVGVSVYGIFKGQGDKVKKTEV